MKLKEIKKTHKEYFVPEAYGKVEQYIEDLQESLHKIEATVSSRYNYIRHDPIVFDYEFGEASFVCTYYTLETEKQAEVRIKREEKQKENNKRQEEQAAIKREQKERKELERLKKKYENTSP